MKVILKYIIILVGSIFVLGFVSYIYFVTQFSAVYPPIKEYKFPTNVSGLRLAIIKTLDNHEKFEYQFTDTIGNMDNGFAYYIVLKIKDPQMDNEFTFKFFEPKGQTNMSRIDLIGAFDRINNTGGYKIKENHVPHLVDIFDKEFIDKLVID